MEAFSKRGEAARAALTKLGIDVPFGDPVKPAMEALGDRGVILNLARAFESIELSDDKAAQELAGQFREAVNNHFLKK